MPIRDLPIKANRNVDRRSFCGILSNGEFTSRNGKDVRANGIAADGRSRVDDTLLPAAIFIFQYQPWNAGEHWLSFSQYRVLNGRSVKDRDLLSTLQCKDRFFAGII